MSYPYHSVPFWDFVRSMDAADRSGEGVDHPAFGAPGFGPGQHPFAYFSGGAHPFGPHHGPHGFGGPHGCRRGRGHPGRHCHRPSEPKEPPKEGEPNEPQDPPTGEESEGPFPGPRHPFGGRRGCGRPHGPGGRRYGPQAPFPYANAAPFDMSGLINALASHPIAQALRDFAGQAAETSEEAEITFTPPIDIFSIPSAYVLHVAIPGAKKEDVGVNWDADKNELNVAGVVYRPGDEEFLKNLSKKERKVGVFERSVKLPPGEEEKEEVDVEGITARLEDGVLIVTVPKVEKEWTEIKKVDIE